MRRRLTPREITLLLILLILVLFAAYYLLFIGPTRQKLDQIEGQIAETQDLIALDQMKLARKQEMENELKEIFDSDPDPVSLAPFDNSRNVMLQLNTVLSSAADYSLNFSEVKAGQEEDFVQRSISLNFTCSGYENARLILQQLHDGQYRCMLDDLSLSLVQEGGIAASFLDRLIGEEATVVEDSTQVHVAATIVFFEYIEEDSPGA